MNVSANSFWNRLVGSSGLEPPTSRLSGARSNHLSYEPMLVSVYLVSRTIAGISPPGGDDGNRTHDPLLAGQVLSQLSYTPIFGVISLSEWSLKIEQQMRVVRAFARALLSPSFLVFAYYEYE